VADFSWAALAECYGYNIETVWPILNPVRRKKIPRCLCHLLHLRCRNNLFRWRKLLICSGLDLDKDNRAVAIDHNKVDFTGLAGEITRKRLKPFSFEEFLALPLSPFAEQLDVCKQLISVEK